MPNCLLLIEDDTQIVEMLQNYLEKEGYLVTAAVDGLSGWHEFQRSEFDLVIVDVMMPKLDGIEVTKRIWEKSSLRLREKIEDSPSHPRYIKTLWGIGYRWEG